MHDLLALQDTKIKPSIQHAMKVGQLNSPSAHALQVSVSMCASVRYHSRIA